MIKEVVNISDDVMDGNNGKKKVESLLDFNDNKKNNTKKNDNFDPLMDLDDIDDGDVNGKKEKDGNSSDELDAFFDEMANEDKDDKKNIKKESTKKNTTRYKYKG